MPRVSVIIPTYNRMGMVMQAIRSVLIQTYNDLEVLVIDDGSRDITQQVVTSLDDVRLHYIYQTSAGLPAARNTGIHTSQGEYIAFLDDDDFWDVGKLAPQVALLEANPEIGLVSSGWRNISEDGTPIMDNQPWLWAPDLDLKTWLYACPTIVNAVLVRREWLERVGGFDDRLAIHEDWDLWLRLAAEGCRMAWLEQVSCAYRIHGSNMVRDTKKMRSSMERILDKFFSRTDLPEEIQAIRQKVYGQAYLRVAARAIGAGQIQEGQENLRAAGDANPDLLLNQGEILIKNLLDLANNPLVTDDRERFIGTLYQSLPEGLCNPSRFHKTIRSSTARSSFYEAHRQKNWRRVRRGFWALLAADPACLKERGVLSVTMEAIIGPGIAQKVRSSIKHLNQTNHLPL